MRERPTNPAGADRTPLTTQDMQNAVIRERRQIRRSGASSRAKSRRVVGHVKRRDDAARAAHIPVAHVDSVLEAALYLRGQASSLADRRDLFTQIRSPLLIIARARESVVATANAEDSQPRLPNTRWRLSTPATWPEPTAPRSGVRSRSVRSTAVANWTTEALHTSEDAHERQLARSGG
jgi:hypothetical protein